MKRVVLINPWIYDFSAFDLWLKPLGLLYIASFLKERGFDVTFLDCLDRFHPAMIKNGIKPINRGYGTGRFYEEEIEKPKELKSIRRKYKRFGIPYSIVKNELKGMKDIDAVVITSIMTYWYPGVLEIIKLAREELPEAKIILGGIYPTLLTEHARNESGADAVIDGLNPYPAFKELDDSIDKFSVEEFLNTYSPAYHLYNVLPYVSMVTSLGCSFHCTYCVSNLLVPEFFPVDKEKILSEIDICVNKLKVKDIAFYDDAILFNPGKHFLPLFEEVLKRKYKVRFHTPNGINARFITREVALMLYRCNFQTIRIGFESSRRDFQKKTGGKVTDEEVETAVSNLLNAGVARQDIGIYVMAGRSDEQKEDVIKTLEFVSRFGVKVFVSEYSPVPGSADFERFGNFKDLDPLWQNNSIAFLQNGWSFEDMQEIKDIKNRINKAV